MTARARDCVAKLRGAADGLLAVEGEECRGARDTGISPLFTTAGASLGARTGRARAVGRARPAFC